MATNKANQTAWVQLLQELIRSFLLLRDLFGYLVPGVSFVLVGVYANRISLQELLARHSLPTWVIALVCLVLSYAAGHFLAAVGHWIQDFGASLPRRWKRKKDGQKPGQKRREKKRKVFPLRSESLTLHYRRLYPELFIELDRRSTLALLRTGLGAGFLLGSWFLYPSLAQGLMLAAGVILLWSGYSGRKHVDFYRIATLRAVLRTERKKS